jgi:hypothetical protein
MAIANQERVEEAARPSRQSEGKRKGREKNGRGERAGKKVETKAI